MRVFVGLLLASVALTSSSVRGGEWVPLFNGQNFDGWQAVDGPLSSWKMEDDMIYCSGGGGGWLSTKKEYGNFEIELEFRVPPGGNSGVFLRAPHKNNPAYAGMEIQILDDRAPQYAKLNAYQYCGSLYGIAAPKTRASKPAGEWQKMNITCDGRQVAVVLNGTPIIDVNLDDHQDAAAEHPGINRKTGYVGLQNHGTRLDFRAVRLRELP